jgi:hypothetical protein
MTETEVVQIIIYTFSWTIYYVYENHFCKVKKWSTYICIFTTKRFLKQNM